MNIEDAAFSYDTSTTDAELTWTAPIDPGGSVERYEIRYAYGGPFDWESAIPVVDPPRPVRAGREQSYRFRYPDIGQQLLAAIVSVDGSGNRSQPSNTAGVLVPGHKFYGECLEVYSRAPTPGIALDLEGRRQHATLTTGADGTFAREDLAPQELVVSFRFGGGGDEPTHFDIVESLIIDRDVFRPYLLIPYQFSEVLPDRTLLGLFKLATLTDRAPGTLRKWERRPVPVFIPPFENEAGVDYAETARRAVQRWMDRTGFVLFQLVGASPEWGIELIYRTPEELGQTRAITRHEQGPDGLPLRDEIHIRNDFSNLDVLYRILLHEFGHTIRLGHLPVRDFIMYGGQPLPDDITDDEVRLVRLLEALPNLTEMSIYREVEP